MGLFDFLKKGEEKPAVTPATNPIFGNTAQETYTVKSGDSLSKIAKNLYGDAQQWHKIHEANKDKISDPNLIQPGQEFIIPRD